MIALALILAAATATCDPVLGAGPILDNPHTTYLFIGEHHGTAETPAIFGDLVCAAPPNRTVIVAIEQSTREQPNIDAYLASNGGLAARTRFLRSPIWSTPFKDGRSSQAMFALIERLRVFKRAGRIAGVVAFVPLVKPAAGADMNDLLNQAMADELARIAATSPDALVMVITGSVHASKASVDFGSGAILPAAARLPTTATISLLADGATGTAWNCTTACGVHAWQSTARGPRGVTIGSRRLTGDAGGAFDGTIYVGAPFTASPPIVPTDKE